jgi:hypothetical protein
MDTRFRQVDVRSSTLCTFRPHPAEDLRQAWHGRLMSPLPALSQFHSLMPDVDNSSASNQERNVITLGLTDFLSETLHTLLKAAASPCKMPD